MYNLIEKYKSNPLMPKNINDLAGLEKDSREQGFEELADYIKSWILYIEHQKKAEWDDI